MDNKPFTFLHFMSNNDTIQDLVERIKKYPDLYKNEDNKEIIIVSEKHYKSLFSVPIIYNNEAHFIDNLSLKTKIE